MNDQRTSGTHLSDVEIDAYWKQQLSPADEPRVEQHLLECAACRQRVELIEAVVDQLSTEGVADSRHASYWRMAAMVLAVISLAAFALWWQSRTARPESARVTTADAPLVAVSLAPPTRDGSPPGVPAPPAGSVVLFALDAREAATPGTRFDVRLLRRDRPVAYWTGLASDVSGSVRVPVAAGQLEGGSYTFELQAPQSTVGFPFLIRP